MTTITALPTPPSRQDPTNFNDRADAFLGALPTFVTQTNAVASETNTASANAVAANQAVIAATNITKWVSGTTYANGAVVWSPINGLAYRRITVSGSGTTDPSLDTTNYKQVNGTGDVSTSGNQTINGVKTFSSPIEIDSGGTGANTASAAFDNLKQAATDTYSGVVQLATTAESQAGTDTTKVITAATLRDANIVSANAVVSTSGTSIDFIGIPSWVKRITVMLSGVSINSSSSLIIRLGTPGGFETANYLGSVTLGSGSNSANYSSGFQLTLDDSSSSIHHGTAVIEFLGQYTWVERHTIAQSNAATIRHGAGTRVMGGTLDRIRLTTVSGTAVFDAGIVNILWE